MNNDIFGNGREGNILCNAFSDREVFQLDAVKNEPREIDIFNKYKSSSSETDHKHATDSYQEQNEEKVDAKNPNPEDLYYSKFSNNLSRMVQIKNEEIDIFHVEIKSETGEEKSISRLKSLEVQEETISGDELTKEQSSADEIEHLFFSKKHQLKDETEKIQCKFCSIFFTCRKDSKIHERLHLIEKPFQCKICSKSFRRKDHVKVHERGHTGEKPFHCKICYKAFSTSSSLKVHKGMHAGAKQFHCKICSKSFCQKSQVKVHERSHTGEKPFHCEICFKAFTTSGYLKVHERMHAGEKPFHCKICSKAFTTSSHLQIHERIHTGEKPFQCKICSKRFTESGNLRAHGRVHTGEKPFYCKICFKAYTSSSKLKVHACNRS